MKEKNLKIPIIVFGSAYLVLMLIRLPFTMFIPVLADNYASQGRDLPEITQLVINLLDFLRPQFIRLLVSLGLAAIVWKFPKAGVKIILGIIVPVTLFISIGIVYPMFLL